MSMDSARNKSRPEIVYDPQKMRKLLKVNCFLQYVLDTLISPPRSTSPKGEITVRASSTQAR